jgi:hypothetical protein
MLRQRGGNLADRGAYLSLQDHGDPVWFRGLKLRTLGPDEQLDRTPVTPQPIPPEVLAEEQKKLQRIVERRRRAAKARARKAREGR